MEENLTTAIVGKVYSVNRSSQKGLPKKPVGYGYFKLGVGMSGDAHSNPDESTFQVSLVAHEDYPKDGKNAAVGIFGENITTEGLELRNLSIGTQLAIGDDVLLQIGQIGKECPRDDSAKNLADDCFVASHVVFAYVRGEGEINEGDKIRIIKPE